MAESFLMKEANRIATKMLKDNKTIAPIDTWGNGKTLFVTVDENAIYATDVIDVDGRSIFIGTLLRGYK